MMGKRTYGELPSHQAFKEALESAHELGADFSEWDEDQLVQSAEYANDVLPTLRSYAGYSDNKYGTWTDVPEVDGMTEEEAEEELSGNVEELLEAFWDGYAEKHIEAEEEEAEEEEA